MMPQTVKKILVLIFVLCFAVYLGFNLSTTGNKLQASSNDKTPFPKITDTYSQLFSSTGIELLKPSYTFFNKYKSPISTFHTKDESYNIIIYKIDSIPEVKRLSEFINVEWNATIQRTEGLIYDGSTATELIRLSNAKHKILKPTMMYIKFDGAEIGKTFATDSLIEYNMHFDGISGQYTPLGDIEFFAENRKAFSGDVIASIAFLKKNDIIYLLILSSGSSATDEFDLSLLHRLITND